MTEHPKVFVSYSHDNQDHKNWVRALSTLLRQHLGVHVILDQWDLRFGGDLSLFMEHGLSSSDLVLCVCSDGYVQKANAGNGGAGYEKMILTQSLLKSTDIDYIIPIVRNNTDKVLPRFLGTKLWIDFSDDCDYISKLGELAARIYGQDLAQKPPLGDNPFSKQIANEITIRTDLEKAKYHNPLTQGYVSFDFKNNSGQFLIGSGEYEFVTCWSECGATTIYGYRDRVKLIGYLPGMQEIPVQKDFSLFDFTSRTREVGVGEVLIWMNDHGKFAATRITAISVKSRGATENNLSFE